MIACACRPTVGGFGGEAALLRLCYKRQRVTELDGTLRLGLGFDELAVFETLNSKVLARLQWYDDRNTLVI